jgi:hypothetical protein
MKWSTKSGYQLKSNANLDMRYAAQYPGDELPTRFPLGWRWFYLSIVNSSMKMLHF